MKTNLYAKLCLENCDAIMKRDNPNWRGKWSTEYEDSDVVVVSRTIDTVAGARQAILRFENGVVYPLVVLNEGFDFEDCSTETQLNLLLSMNEVNRLYSGEIISFIYDENGSTVAVLRGAVCPTFQNEPDFSKDDFDELSHYVSPAIERVISFIIDINNDFGTDALSDLFDIFE